MATAKGQITIYEGAENVYSLICNKGAVRPDEVFASLFAFDDGSEILWDGGEGISVIDAGGIVSCVRRYGTQFIDYGYLSYSINDDTTLFDYVDGEGIKLDDTTRVIIFWWHEDAAHTILLDKKEIPVVNDGAAGVSFGGVVERYKVTNTNEKPSKESSGWEIGTIPSEYSAAMPNLWNYEVIYTIENGVTHTTETDVQLVGKWGKGVSGITEQYACTSDKSTTPTTGTSTIPSDYGQDKPYLWNREKVNYDNGSAGNWTDWQIIAYWGQNGTSPISIDVSPQSLTLPLDADGKNLYDEIYSIFFSASRGDGVNLTCVISSVTPIYSSTGVEYNIDGNELIIHSLDGESFYGEVFRVEGSVKQGTTTIGTFTKQVQVVGQNAGQTVTGPPGKGIASLTPYYARNNSSSSAPVSGWSTTQLLPTQSQQYVWCKFLITYDDGTSGGYTSAHICVSFTNGIGSYATKYGVNNTLNTPPSTWLQYQYAIVLFGASNKYLWEQVTITYTDGRDDYVTTRVILTYVKDGESPVTIELSNSNVLFTKYGANVVTHLTVYKGSTNVTSSATVTLWDDDEHIDGDIERDPNENRFNLYASLINGKYFDGEIVGTITVNYDNKAYYKDIHFQCNMRKSAWSIMDWETVKKEASHTFYSDDNVTSDLFISDIVIKGSSKYRCIKGFTAGTGTGKIPWADCVPGTTKGNEYWAVFNYTENVATGLLLADQALIKNLLVNHILVTSDDGADIYGGFLNGAINGSFGTVNPGNYRLWLGNANPALAPFSVDKDGNEVAKNLSVTNIYRKFERHVLSESETSENLSNYLTTNIEDDDPTALTAVAYQNSNRSGGYAIKRRIVLPYAGNVIGKEFEIYSPNTINDSNGNTAAFIVTVQNAQGGLPDFREMDGSFLTIINGFANSVGFNLKRFASANDITCKLKVVSVMYNGYPRWLILDNKNVFVSTSAEQEDSQT